jgi:hypothetical protein
MDNAGLTRRLPPLAQAAARGQLARVRELLAAGVSPNQTDEDGHSALGHATEPEIARVLIRAGATADPPGISRPIHGAARHGDLDLVKQLVAADADLSGAVDIAAINGQIHVVRWLVEEAGADVDDEDEGLTSLLNAAEAGQTEMVRELIRLGADRDRTYKGQSAADLAAGMGHDALAAELRGEEVEPPQLGWMKWFGDSWNDSWRIDDQDAWTAHWKATLQSYEAHLAKLLPTLPTDLRCLVEAGGTITLHDAHVKLAQSDAARRRVIIDLEPYHHSSALEMLRLRLIYADAEVVAPDREQLQRYAVDFADVMNGELDAAAGGRFEHRIQFEMDYPTLVIRFADVRVHIARFGPDGIDVAAPAEFFQADT